MSPSGWTTHDGPAMTRPAGANPTALARIKTELADAARALARPIGHTLRRAVRAALDKRPRTRAAPPDVRPASSPRGPATVRRVPTLRARSRDGPPCAGPPKALNRQPCHVMARSVPERLNAHVRALGTSPPQVRSTAPECHRWALGAQWVSRSIERALGRSGGAVGRELVLVGRDSCGRNGFGARSAGRGALRRPVARSAARGYSCQC